MKISCPHCGQHFEVDDADVGKDADCTNCGKRFPIEANMATELPALEPSPAVDSDKNRPDRIDAIVRQYLRPGDDELMRQALEIIIRERKASTSYFQRRFRIGYRNAAELVDELERRGIIGGPTEGGGQREILLPPLGENLPPNVSGGNHPDSSPSGGVGVCPFCGGEIVSGVKKCRHCGEWLDMDARPRNQVIYCLLGIYGGVVGVHNFYAEEIERAAIKWGIGFLGAVLWGAEGNIGWLFCALGLNEIIALFDLAGCHSRVGIVKPTPPKTENKNSSMNNSKFPLNYNSLSHEE